MLLERSRPSPQAQQTQPYAKSIVHFLCRTSLQMPMRRSALPFLGSSAAAYSKNSEIWWPWRKVSGDDIGRPLTVVQILVVRSIRWCSSIKHTSFCTMSMYAREKTLKCGQMRASLPAE